MNFVRYNWFCKLCNINSRMNFVRYNWFCKLCNINSRMNFVRYNWFCKLCNINSRMNFVRYNWFCKLCNINSRMNFVRYNWFCKLCNINSRMNFVRYNWFCKLCLLIYFVWSDLHAVSVKSTSQILKSENFLPTQWCKSSDSIIKNFHRCILHYKVNVLLKDTHHQRKKKKLFNDRQNLDRC